MGFFDFALRCTLVVASVLADGGGIIADEHRKNNVEIELGNGGLIGSFSEPRAGGAGFAGAGNFSGPDHGSLNGSGGDFGHDRLTNNDIGGSFGNHRVAGQFEKPDDVKDIGHDFDGVDGEHGFNGVFGGGITRLNNVFGGQKFGGVGGRSNGGIKGGFGNGIVQGHNIHDNVHGGRNTFTGSHGAEQAEEPLIIQGKGIRFGHNLAGRQGTGFVSAHRGFGATLQGSHDSKLFGTGSGDGIGRGHGTLGGKFNEFSGDLGRGPLNVHETNLAEGIFEMMEGGKLIGFESGVVGGHLQPHAVKSPHGFSSGIHAEGLSKFGGGIGGGHDNFQGSIRSGLSSSDGDLGHGKAGSFANVGSLVNKGGFEGGNEHFSELQDHGHSSSLGFNSGSEFGAQDEFRGQEAVIKGSIGGVVSQRSSFLGGSSLGGPGSAFSGDILRRDIHSSVSGGNVDGRVKEGAFVDIGGKLRGSVHHTVFRGDINSGVSRGSLRDFVGSEALGGVHRGKTSSFNHEGHDGGSIGGFSSSIGDEKKNGDSIGGFGFSPILEGKEDRVSFRGLGISNGQGEGTEHVGSFGSFSSSTVHGGKGGGSIRGFGGSTVHGGKENEGSFDDFSSSPVLGGKVDGDSFGGFGSSIGHEGGKDDGGSFGAFGSSIVQEGKEGRITRGFGSSVVHGEKEDGGSFGGFSSSSVQGLKGGGSIGFGSSIVQEGKINGVSFGGVGTSPVHGGKGEGSLGGFGGGNVHGGKEDGGSSGGNRGHGNDFDIGGFGQHAIVGGVGGGNFFGYEEDDFLASKDDIDFTGGLAGGFGVGHGARALNFNGHVVHVGGSNLGGFGGALSGRDGGNVGVTFNSGFIGSVAGEHGGAVGSSIKPGHGGGVPKFDGADNLSNFDGDVGSKGFDDFGGKGVGDIGGKGLGDIVGKGFGDIGGSKFDGPRVTVHGRENHALTEGKSGDIGGGVKEGFGVDKSPVGKFGRVVGVHGRGGHGRGVHGRGGHDGGAESSVGGVQGKGKLVTHHPGNPFGINGSE